MMRISNNSLELLLHGPQDGFYCGTRFDRAGVFDGVLWDGVQLCDRWFERYDPFAHDAVCGPAEEFSQIGFEEAAPGGTFLKPGVGLLVRPDDAPYDRFRLYGIADPGSWELAQDAGKVVFKHSLPGIYEYVKEIVLTGPSSFEIRHSFASPEPLALEVYNHNFWTLGLLATGPSRLVDFPFRPAGDWRAEYDSVAFTASGVRFSRPLEKGESVYTGNIHDAAGGGMPYIISLRDNGIRVLIRGSVPVVRTVLWANHRIACLEPYNVFTSPFNWTVRYDFSHE